MIKIFLSLIFVSIIIYGEIVNRANIDYEKIHSKFTINEIVSNTAMKMAKNIPQQIDYITTFVKVYAFKNTLHMSYQIDTQHEDFKVLWKESNRETTEILFEQAKNVICLHPEYMYLMKEKSLRFNHKYFDANMKLLLEYSISNKDCIPYYPKQAKKQKTVGDRVLEDKKWLENLSKEEQVVALSLIYRDFENHFHEVLMPNAKTNSDKLWASKVYIYGLDYLSLCAKKTPELESIFKSIKKSYILYLKREITFSSFQKEYIEIIKKLDKERHKISKKTVTLFIYENEKKLENAYDSVLVFAKLAA